MDKPKKELAEEWIDYHLANPHVYELICQYANDVLRAGHTKYAIAPIYERLRWHLLFETRTATDFKLPNAHRAYYARLWLSDHPEHPKFFKISTLRSERKPRDRYGRDMEEHP
jgi:hypothetical protein